MITKIRLLGSELALVGTGQVISALGSVIGVRLMTGVLVPEVYGEVALAITFITLIQQILVGPLSGALTRFFNVARENGELPYFFGSSFSLGVKISLVTIGLLSVGALVLWLSGLSRYLVLALFTLVFALVSGFNVLLDSIQTAARQRAVVAWHQGLGQWLRYLAAVGIVLAFGKVSAAAMAGYAAASVVVLGSQVFFFRRKMPVDPFQRLIPDKQWTGRLLSYALPFSSWGLFTWMQMTSDRWALQTFANTTEVGYYTVLFQLGYYPLIMLTNVITQFAAPVLFGQAGDGSDPVRIRRAQTNTWRLLGAALVLTAVGVVAAWLLHPLIFRLFTAPEYHSVSGLFPIMVLSGGIFACGQIASLMELNRGKPKTLLKPKIVMGIAGTLFNIAGAYWLGLNGVVYASAVFSGLYFVWILSLRRGDQS